VLFREIKQKSATLRFTQTESQRWYKQVWKGFSSPDNSKEEWILLLSVPETRRRRQREALTGVPSLSMGLGGKGNNRNQKEG